MRAKAYVAHYITLFMDAPRTQQSGVLRSILTLFEEETHELVRVRRVQSPVSLSNVLREQEEKFRVFALGVIQQGGDVDPNAYRNRMKQQHPAWFR